MGVLSNWSGQEKFYLGSLFSHERSQAREGVTSWRKGGSLFQQEASMCKGHVVSQSLNMIRAFRTGELGGVRALLWKAQEDT